MQLLPGSLILDTYPGNPVAMMGGSPTHTQMLCVGDPGRLVVPALNFMLGLLEWRVMLRYPDTQRTLGKEDIFLLADLRRHATSWGLHKGASVWAKK